MNKEQKEMLESAFGSLPTKEGYELVGVDNRKPKVGEWYFHHAWALCYVNDRLKRPVAIFKKLEPAPKPTTK